MTQVPEMFGSRVFDVFNVLFMLLLMIVTLYPFLYVLFASLSFGNIIDAAPTAEQKAGYLKIFTDAGLDCTVH